MAERIIASHWGFTQTANWARDGTLAVGPPKFDVSLIDRTVERHTGYLGNERVELLTEKVFYNAAQGQREVSRLGIVDLRVSFDDPGFPHRPIGQAVIDVGGVTQTL